MKVLVLITTTILAAPAIAGTPEAMSLLKANCFSCHNPDKEKGGLDLTTRAAALRGSEEGKVLLPGRAAASRSPRPRSGLSRSPEPAFGHPAFL